MTETKGILGAVLNLDQRQQNTQQFMTQVNMFLVQSKRSFESSKCFEVSSLEHCAIEHKSCLKFLEHLEENL